MTHGLPAAHHTTRGTGGRGERRAPHRQTLASGRRGREGARKVEELCEVTHCSPPPMNLLSDSNAPSSLDSVREEAAPILSGAWRRQYKLYRYITCIVRRAMRRMSRRHTKTIVAKRLPVNGLVNSAFFSDTQISASSMHRSPLSISISTSHRALQVNSNSFPLSQESLQYQIPTHSGAFHRIAQRCGDTLDPCLWS
ncbi:hypothetical protein GWK47_053731 [Chionoecetes opilio]|uniref:Uncharacterized protein n=1 Tax=Chionoecetes opilio TaxID=41210 RepID=A0A8J5CPE4_CHIOP|nr:hypothetical protein GWK47_053731 [Chionoecetes opilio]